MEFAKDDRDLVQIEAQFDDFSYFDTKLGMLELEIRRTAFLHLSLTPTLSEGEGDKLN